MKIWNLHRFLSGNIVGHPDLVGKYLFTNTHYITILRIIIFGMLSAFSDLLALLQDIK